MTFFWLWWYFLMCERILNKDCAETKERLRHFLSAKPRKEEGEIWAIFHAQVIFASDSSEGGKKKAGYDWVCYCVILKHDLNISNYRIFQANQSCYRTEKASLSFALQENVGDILKGKTQVTSTPNRFCVIVICWSNPEQYGLFCSVCGLSATILKYSITREKPSNKHQNHNFCHLKFPPFCWHLLF